MEDKRTIVYPSLLLIILFLLIFIMGYLQIRVTQRNIQGLLIAEGETLLKHVRREIDINFEYLELLDKSPFLITPNLLNLMVYDEAIAEDLYNQIYSLSGTDGETVPYSNVIIVDTRGRTLFKKGNTSIPRDYMKRLISGRQNAVVKLPGSKDRHLLVGMRRKEDIVFLILNENELALLRKRLMVKSILEREERGFGIMGAVIYDSKNVPYAAMTEKKGNAFTLHRPLDSKYLPGYTMEILISKEPADSAFRRTAFSFIIMLVFLVVAGALSIYAIFSLERRHGRKMKEIEKEMELKERLVSLGRLASGMAHEIRNPLNAIGMSAQRLKREFVPEKDKEEYFRFIDIMRGELLRVDRIVEEFLLSTRSHVPFLRENLYTIVEELATVLGEKARTYDVKIINRVDKAIILECQKERLKQALYNLILNGMEAIKRDGTIELFTETKGKHVELHVRDSGPGIKADDLRTIFEYYYTTKDKGMGLGLPISYLIVKDHGGDLKVMSEEGKGATFILSLPLSHQISG